jgi:Na+-transporting methylmalonyl-CoA/oxaloacetate decarboxylase gamma subunit
MTENLFTALQITLIGMSLVFGAIVLFWGLMSALVRLAADARERPAEDERRLKQRAAVAAVAVALMEAQARAAAGQPNVPPLPPTALVSAWQAVMRANQLSQRGPVR